MPPEISGHSSLPLHCFAPPFCNVSQLFLQKRLERTLDDLHKGTGFLCKITNYGQIFGFQRNTSRIEMVKHMQRIVFACLCEQKEKRWASGSSQFYGVPSNGMIEKHLNMKILWGWLKTLRSASHFLALSKIVIATR